MRLRDRALCHAMHAPVERGNFRQLFALVFALVLNHMKRKSSASTDTIISVFSSLGTAVGLGVLLVAAGAMLGFWRNNLSIFVLILLLFLRLLPNKTKRGRFRRSPIANYQLANAPVRTALRRKCSTAHKDACAFLLARHKHSSSRAEKILYVNEKHRQ